METVFQVGLSNTVVALGLAIVAAASRLLRARPALVHALWVLVLIALVAPPLVWVPVWARSAETGSAPRPPGARAGRAMTTGPRVPSGDYGSWTYRDDMPRARERPEWAADARRLVAEGRMLAPPIWKRPSSDGPHAAVRLARLAAAPPSWVDLLALAAWLGVALSWWGLTAWRVRRFHRLLRWAEPAPAGVQDLVRAMAGRLGMRRGPEAWFIPAPISPMLWSLAGRPRLLIPAALWSILGDEEREALLVHELAHYKRRDHWVRLLEVAVTGLHWWNPLVWWSRRSLREAEERCCDAWVVSTFPGRARAYARVILKTLDFLAEAPEFAPMGGTSLVPADAIRRRLTHILGGTAARPLSRPAAVALTGLAVAALGLRPGLPSPRWFRALDLGNLGGERVEVRRLNDRGQVIGWSTVPQGPGPHPPGSGRMPHSFRTAPGRPIDPATDDLYALAGVRDDVNTALIAQDINQAGQALVQVHQRTGPTRAVRQVHRGLVIAGRRVIELDPGAGDGPEPTALNDDGLVAGTIMGQRPPSGPAPRPASAPPGPIRKRVGFVATAGRPIDPARDDIGHLGGVGYPQGTPRGGPITDVKDINARGQVIGTSWTAGGWRHGFRTGPGRPVDPATDDLGSLSPDGDSEALAVNDLGQVVGSSLTDELTRRHEFRIDPLGRVIIGGSGERRSRHACRTASDRRIDPATDDLGTLGGPDSVAYGINNRGEVVGQADCADGQPHAFLFTEGRMIDLNTRVALPDGWVLRCAYDINERGQVVATAVDERDVRQGRQRGYLLTPAPGPGPPALLILGTAIIGSGLGVRLVRDRLADRRRGLATDRAPPDEIRSEGS